MLLKPKKVTLSSGLFSFLKQVVGCHHLLENAAIFIICQAFDGYQDIVDNHLSRQHFSQQILTMNYI